MKLHITVITRSHSPGVIKRSTDHYTVRVSSVPEKNRANKEACRRLADYFSVRRSAVCIIQGHHTRKKIVEIQQ